MFGNEVVSDGHSGALSHIRAHEYDTKLIEIYIGRLRKKIDEGSIEPLIKTVRHLGYAVRGDSSA